MSTNWIITTREFKARISTRSFLLLSVLGPMIVLGLIYILFALGGQTKQHWEVLIADPAGIMESKIMAHEDKSVTYSFVDNYLEIEEFRDGKKFKRFDALLEVNEKVLSNKTGFVFYREKPSLRMQTRIQYQFERRLEEVIVKQFKTISLADFRKIKQPVNVSFRDVNDPMDEASDLNGWAGFFFGTLIIAFVFLFGMTILRSVSREKSNRIVEVLLASASPNQLLTGKILGVGLAAFVQFIVWVLIIGTGLYLMRELLFPDLLDASNLNMAQLSLEAKDLSYQESVLSAREYNQFVELVFERLQFGISILYFLLFFVGAYLFYGAFFAAIGATSGSESDGQQFILPLLLLMLLSLYAGYHMIYYPESTISTWFHYLPFTSPVAVMVKLHQGYSPGEGYQLFVSLVLLLISALGMLIVAGRLYKNGILQFGHRLRWKHVFKWMRPS